MERRPCLAAMASFRQLRFSSLLFALLYSKPQTLGKKGPTMHNYQKGKWLGPGKAAELSPVIAVSSFCLTSLTLA